jgi:hypothetical protein
MLMLRVVGCELALFILPPAWHFLSYLQRGTFYLTSTGGSSVALFILPPAWQYHFTNNNNSVFLQRNFEASRAQKNSNWRPLMKCSKTSSVTKLSPK